MARLQFQSIFPEVYGAQATYDAGSIAQAAEEVVEVTVTGAALGDLVLCSLSIDVADLELDAEVTAADTVTVQLSNNTGGAIDLASATINVVVLHPDMTNLIALT